MRRSAWIGTIGLHGAVIALVAWCVPVRSVPDAVDVAVELVAPTPTPTPSPTPSRSPSPSRVTASAAAPVTAPGRRSGGRRGSRGPVSAIEVESGVGGRGGDGDGHGVGDGGGDSDGLGVRVGPAASDPVPVPKPIAMAPPPKKSKARPARLIWPVRERAESQGRVFLFHLKIDASGTVSGVRLLQGFSVHANEEASNGAWRFRYDPARDDDGNPIATELDQKLMIE